MAAVESRERTNQKARTERAIVEACVELIRQRGLVTMPEVAKAAMVSEATAYRYFPDLASLLAKALAEDWPTPAEALGPVAASKRSCRTRGFCHPLPPPRSCRTPSGSPVDDLGDHGPARAHRKGQTRDPFWADRIRPGPLRR